MTSIQNRIADPGFAAAMNAKEEAVAQLRRLGVPEDQAIAIVQRVYSTGCDRGLHLGMRGLREVAAPTAP